MIRPRQWPQRVIRKVQHVCLQPEFLSSLTAFQQVSKITDLLVILTLAARATCGVLSIYGLLAGKKKKKQV